jgi:hypothetical protein
MNLSRIGLAVVLLLPVLRPASAAVWTNVDSSFAILNALDTIPADPKTYTIQAKNISANTYTGVHFILPYHWIVDNIPASVATASSWNNGTSQWNNGGTTIEPQGYAMLTMISDVNVLPNPESDPYTSTPASVLATDMVANYYVGNFVPNQVISFNVVLDFSPGFVKSLFAGYFIVPEPGTLGLLAFGACGLLLRRRHV